MATWICSNHSTSVSCGSVAHFLLFWQESIAAFQYKKIVGNGDNEYYSIKPALACTKMWAWGSKCKGCFFKSLYLEESKRQGHRQGQNIGHPLNPYSGWTNNVKRAARRTEEKGSREFELFESGEKHNRNYL